MSLVWISVVAEMAVISLEWLLSHSKYGGIDELKKEDEDSEESLIPYYFLEALSTKKLFCFY